MLRLKVKKAASMQQFVKVFFPSKNEESDLVMADSAGKFTVTPEHLKAGQGNYVYLKPMTPVEFDPRISLRDPFQTINEIRISREINYPLTGPMLILKEEAPLDPYIEGHKTIKLGDVTISAPGTNVFRDKYIGHLDSLVKLGLNSDFIGECGYLNCVVCGHGTKPIEGKIYPTWISKRPKPIDHGEFHADEVADIIYHYPKYTEEELLKMNNLSKVKAYYIHREFYQPNYDKTAFLETVPDFRNTLLWRPLVTTNEKGEATVEFFCSDLNTHFVGTIEGASGDGLLGNTGFDFFVRKKKIVKN